MARGFDEYDDGLQTPTRRHADTPIRFPSQAVRSELPAQAYATLPRLPNSKLTSDASSITRFSAISSVSVAGGGM
jgi:hypothetical protein